MWITPIPWISTFGGSHQYHYVGESVECGQPINQSIHFKATLHSWPSPFFWHPHGNGTMYQKIRVFTASLDAVLSQVELVTTESVRWAAATLVSRAFNLDLSEEEPMEGGELVSRIAGIIKALVEGEPA